MASLGPIFRKEWSCLSLMTQYAFGARVFVGGFTLLLAMAVAKLKVKLVSGPDYPAE
jgi:hypothetical protein